MALIATFNELEISALYPIGTIIMYHGTGIGGGDTANILTRTDPISIANGDSIDFGQGDWYVCNGVSSTPDIITTPKMIRGSATSGSVSGTDNAATVSHTHSGNSSSAGTHSHTLSSSTGAHTHNMRTYNGGAVPRVTASNTWFWIGNYQDQLGLRYTDAGGSHTHTISGAGSHDHGGTCNAAGSSGTGANIPAYNTLIFVIKMA